LKKSWHDPAPSASFQRINAMGGRAFLPMRCRRQTAVVNKPLVVNSLHVDREAAALIEGLPAEVVMADTAYDADHLRQAIAAKGALAASQHPVTRAQISARRASLCPAPSRGMLLLKA
jgi:hypothetical protein